jgi:hypothetical protein
MLCGFSGGPHTMRACLVDARQFDIVHAGYLCSLNARIGGVGDGEGHVHASVRRTSAAANSQKVWRSWFMSGSLS